MSDKTEALEIFYIRHADAEKGPSDDRDVCDRDITELGELQLKYLTKRFEGAKFDAIFSSPLVRTLKTAAAVANADKDKPVIEIMPELIERGATPGYSGCSLDYLKKYYENIKYCEDKFYENIWDDTKEDTLLRAKAVIEYLLKRFGYGKKIVLVSHGVYGINFYQAAMGIEKEYNFRMTTFNTAVTKIKFSSDGVRRIAFHNDVSHLLPIMPDFQYEI